MNRLLILSDCLVIRSDEHPESCVNSPAQTSPQTRARSASDRTGAAWLADRDLQALWAAELPLRRRTGAWPETVFVGQPTWWATPQRLCVERRSRAGRPVHRQLPQITRNAQRDLRDQRGTPAATRGSRVDRHGPGTRRPRLRQGGRHSRRHGCVLSCRRRPAVKSRGAR
jgi:hypothetical protein